MPRIAPFAAVIAIAALVHGSWWWLEMTPDGVRRHWPGRDAIPAALVACVVWLLIARTSLRRIGARRRLRRGGDLWWRDQDWPRQGVERRVATGVRGTWTPLVLSAALTGLLCVAGWQYLDSHANIWRDPYLFGWMPHVPGAFLVAAYALPFAWICVVLFPRLGRGRLIVAWPTFPQFTGGRCAFHVATSPGGARIDGVRVFLRCIRTPFRPLLPLATWNARLVWVAEARLPLASHVGPESHLRAEFDVPATAPPTDLHADDAVRWEVLVLGTVGSADYVECVDVPVYAPVATP
jgi:hypothetical protein